MTWLRIPVLTVGTALSQIWTNKIRSMLTTLGIIIAVASVIIVSSVAVGLKQFMLDQFASFGANKVWIFPDWPDDQPERYTWRQVRITPDQARGLIDNCPSLKRISPIMSMQARVQVGDQLRDFVKVEGISPDWHEIEQRFVTVGRPFKSIDEEEKAQVCLINDKGVQELGLPADPTGTIILLDGRRFTIIGVVETRAPSPMFGRRNETQLELLIPFSTGELMRPEPGMYIIGQTRGAEYVEDVKAEVRFYMRRVRGLGPGEPNTFGVEAIDQVIGEFNKIAAVFSAGLAGLVGISLVVGGIGIMNIMLVSVSERTHEIGLRKAVGAQPAVIMLQFLVEAVVLCLVGCAIGIVAGAGVIMLLKLAPDSPVSKSEIPAWSIVLSVAFSAFTGIVFGMGPAIKAASLDPIEALRHE